MDDLRALFAAGADPDRKLEIDEFINFWIVSFISEEQAWCITAAEGTEEFGNLKLQPCDFSGTAKNQLWYIPYESAELELQIRSALDDSMCITVNHGNNIFEGVRARLSDCENGLTTFYGPEGHIHVADDPSYCLTNRGPRPHPTDWIHAKTCIERADFFWLPIPNIPYHVQLKRSGGEGCAQPREGSRRVFLDTCDEEKAWRVSPINIFGGAALLHSGLDDSKCLRAGTGTRVRDGTRMAVVDCDPEDVLQHFVSTVDGEIKVAGRANLCMVFRGTSANIGHDPIIMKTCNDKQEEWDVIDIFPGV
jgi:hypothetical protein